MKKKMSLRIRRLLNLVPKALRHSLYRNLVKLPGPLSSDFKFKIAETESELLAAFSLLHDSYVRVGLMNPLKSGLRVTPYHGLPTTVTIVGKYKNKVVATVSIVMEGRIGLPCEKFVNLRDIKKKGQRVAEISALAVHSDHKGALLLYLLKNMYEWCVSYLDVHHLIAVLTTDSKSQDLYEAILFFNPIKTRIEKKYNFSNNRPVIAEHLDLTQAKILYERAYGQKKYRQNLFKFFTEQKVEQFEFPIKENLENKLSQIANLILNLNPSPRYGFELKGISRRDKNLIVDIYTQNISMTGLCVFIEEKLSAGEQLFIDLRGSMNCTVEAFVVWQDSKGFTGLRIQNPEQKWQARFKEFLKCDQIQEAGGAAA